MKVFKLNDSEYVITRKGITKSFASYKEAALFMYDSGVSWKEIELGFLELLNNSHQCAHYGIGLSGNGPMFVFSEKVAC